MLKVPKIIVTDGDNTILTVPRLSIKEGESLYVRTDSPEGKTLFLQAVFSYLKKSPKQRKKMLERGDVFTWDISNKKKLYNKGVRDVLLIENVPAIMPQLTLQQNIILPLKKINIRLKSKIVDCLQLFNLSPKQFFPASTLSFSEKKIVELIRCIMLLPEIVLIDDIDLSYHVSLQEKVFENLSLLQKNGTIIIATGKTKCHYFSNYHTIKNKRVIEL